MKIRVGVIGVGMIGRCAHVPSFKNIPDVEIIAVADKDISVAERVAREHSIPYFYDDYKKLIERDDIDAVSVATPNYLHAPITIAACKAKKHVLVEKPMATNIDDAEEMVATAKENDVVLMLNQQHRYRPANLKAKELIEADVIGKILAIDGWVGSPGPEFWSPQGKWFFKKDEAMGGPLADLAIHELDLIRWVTGLEVEEVSAFTDTLEKNIEVEDNAVCILRFNNRALGVLHASWTYKPGGMQTVIYGSKGTMVLGGFYYSTPDAKPLVIYSKSLESVVYPQIPAQGKYGTPFEHFIHCIKTKEKPITDGVEGMRSLEVILAAYQSAQEKRIVHLPLPRKKQKS